MSAPLDGPRDSRQLPIYRCEQELLGALATHRVVVVEGPTGSGKTTQIPRILRRGLDLRRVGVTQPRRIAAVSVAWRIAAEEQCEVGGEVGYAIRFDDQTGPDTVIKLMTDGILLMEARTDPTLSAYDVLMIDEAHERSLNIDVVLGLARRQLARRNDLRVIVSSATMAPELFQRFFEPVTGEVPVISVPSRTFPIELRYQPEAEAGDLIDNVVERVLRIHRSREPGHILVFLSGAGDIRTVERDLLRREKVADLVVLPLFASLTREEQEQVFADVGQRRKVVLATNIAETSITIPDVRYVIDSGWAKIPSYSLQTGITTLREEPISSASAEQRAGRAGRTAPGVVWRLYSESSLDRRPERTAPEIQRLDLAEVLLRLIDMGIPEVEKFSLPTQPPRARVEAALRRLEDLGAIDGERQLTPTGQRMTPFPLSPGLARMVIEAAERFPDVVDEVLIVGAFLSTRSPLRFPEDGQEEARRVHRRFRHPLGDAVAQVELYRAWESARRRGRFCEQNFLDHEALEFIAKAHQQLVEIARAQNIEVVGGGPQESIVRAVAAGLADRIIRRTSGGGFETLGGIRVGLHPGSLLAGRPPEWAVAAELVEYSRTYAINVSPLRAEWLVEINPRAASMLRGRPGREQKTVSLPARLRIGSLDLPLDQSGGRPAVELSLADVRVLRELLPGALPPEARKVRGRVHWTPRVTFAGLPLPRLVEVARIARFPAPDEQRPRGIVYNELLEVDRDHHRLGRSLELLLQPAAQKRQAGWVALVANGAGGYWLDLISHYPDAVRTSRVSLEVLADALEDGDDLRSRSLDLHRALSELEERLT